MGPLVISLHVNASSQPFPRRWLFAVSNDKKSEVACAWALKHLCRPCDEVVLLHIYYHSQAHLFEATEHIMQAQAKKFLDRRFGDMLEAAGIAWTVRVHGTSPYGMSVAEGIVFCASRYRADAILLGSNGLSPTMQLVWGSVTRSVCRKSHLPVHVVSRKGHQRHSWREGQAGTVGAYAPQELQVAVN